MFPAAAHACAASSSSSSNEALDASIDTRSAMMRGVFALQHQRRARTQIHDTRIRPAIAFHHVDARERGARFARVELRLDRPRDGIRKRPAIRRWPRCRCECSLDARRAIACRALCALRSSLQPIEHLDARRPRFAHRTRWMILRERRDELRPLASDRRTPRADTFAHQVVGFA